MLILVRRKGESICIGDDVLVSVMGIDRNRVRLGIKAPKHITVDRMEIAERKRLGLMPAKGMARAVGTDD